MSSDHLARSDIQAGAPDEPEYDAVYAAVTATERGRWFLTEYASRNRQADTHALTAAIARVEAAIRNGPAPAPAVSLRRDLIGIAAAIERIMAAIAAQRMQVPDIAGAAERIQDTAFTLRERAADAALCDALDAAAREISLACVPSQNAGQSLDVTELLRDLAVRVHMMALAVAGKITSDGEAPSAATDAVIAIPAAAPTNSEEAGVDAGIESLAQAPLFTMDAQENENLAEAVAALAVPSPAPDAHFEMALQQSMPTGVVVPPDYEKDTEPTLGMPADQHPRWHIEPPEFALRAADREPERQTVEARRVSGPARSLLPETRLSPGPKDDPADLFEAPPAAIPTPAVTPPAAPVRPMPRAAPPDPLAGMRALSEEEVIALFS